MRALAQLMVVTVVCLCLPGCWDYKRINDRGQVFGIGIDPTEQPDLLHFTFQLPTFEDKRASSNESGEGQSTSRFENLSADGHTLAEALTLAQTKSEKQLFLGNLETVILSEELKQKQVKMVLSELVRNPLVDPQAFIVTTTDSQKLLEIGNGLAPSDKLDQILGPQMKPYALATRTRLWDFWRDTVSVGLDAMDTWVTLSDDGLEVLGGYIYHNFQGVMRVSPQQMWAINAARGRLARTSYSWKRQDGTYAAVQNVNAKSSVSVDRETGRIHIRLGIRLKGILGQEDDQGMQPLDTAALHEYEVDLATHVRDQVVDCFRSLDEQQVDVVGYGRVWLIRHPEQRQEIRNHWNEWLKAATVSVTVGATITQRGALV